MNREHHLMMTAMSTMLRRRIPAFTLIELLVVIAIVGLVVGITLPALSKAKQTARTTREIAGGQQLGVAYTVYSTENRGSLLPGYAPAEWVDTGSPAGSPKLEVLDESGQPVTGVPAQRYPWRIAPYLEYNFAGLYKDEPTLARYRVRSDFRYIISLTPSFGLNGTYLGGDADRRGFDALYLKTYGQFYATRIDQVQRTSGIVTFASTYNINFDDNSLVPGYFRADAPRDFLARWTATGSDQSSPSTPSQFGHIHYRHASGKAAVVYLDGHGELKTFAQLRDMRLWADRATRADWYIGAPN